MVPGNLLAIFKRIAADDAEEAAEFGIEFQYEDYFITNLAAIQTPGFIHSFT